MEHCRSVKLQCDLCNASFGTGPNATQTLKKHCQRSHCQSMQIYDRGICSLWLPAGLITQRLTATMSLLGVCMRPAPLTDIGCYVEGCDFTSQSTRSLETHVQKNHNDKASVARIVNKRTLQLWHCHDIAQTCFISKSSLHCCQFRLLHLKFFW